jgi:SHS2 domain-containing protein
MFDLFEHTADLGLRVSAPTLEELLADAARGLLAMLVANPSSIEPVLGKRIEITATDPPYLLFDWLSELLYVFETDKLLLSEFNVRVETNHQDVPLKLIANCRGETMDASRHEMDHEVKAITYHGLTVEQTTTGWHAQVIVDI